MLNMEKSEAEIVTFAGYCFLLSGAQGGILSSFFSHNFIQASSEVK